VWGVPRIQNEGGRQGAADGRDDVVEFTRLTEEPLDRGFIASVHQSAGRGVVQMVERGSQFIGCGTAKPMPEMPPIITNC